MTFPKDQSQLLNDLIFNFQSLETNSIAQGRSLADESTKGEFKEYAYLGNVQGIQKCFLNIHEPFCMVVVGVQGAGKSHTLSVTLENCLLPTGKNIVNLETPMATLILHYDQNGQNVCEAVGLLDKRPEIGMHVPRENVTILVSPSYFRQRSNHYGQGCKVRPLLFNWSSLNADQIKKLMKVDESENLLYMATLMEMLRGYQKNDCIPSFQNFINEVVQKSTVKGQSAPLMQRLAILESFVAESRTNAAIRTMGGNLESLLAPGTMIIADLTDPLLAKEDANGIFQILVEQFRATKVACGKVLAIDEAHRFMQGTKEDGLGCAILDVARMMRHDGIRLIVSTQSPRAVLPEILELSSLVLMHRFQSKDWFDFLRSRIALEPELYETILQLDTGSAIMFVARHLLGLEESCFTLKIRPRITMDYGFSKLNQ